MSNYRWSICEPDHPDVIEKGSIRKEDILTTFEHFPWIDRLRNIALMKESEVHYSPSLEFENLDTTVGITFSIAGNPETHEFYIFYKRPKTVKTLFGFSKKEVAGYMTEITGQTYQDALQILKAFLDNDINYLEQKIK